MLLLLCSICNIKFCHKEFASPLKSLDLACFVLFVYCFQISILHHIVYTSMGKNKCDVYLPTFYAVLITCIINLYNLFLLLKTTRTQCWEYIISVNNFDKFYKNNRKKKDWKTYLTCVHKISLNNALVSRKWM